jgi:hypothetical protein
MSAGTLEKPRSRRRNGAFPSPDPPPLQNGDHLTRDEFDCFAYRSRKYANLPLEGGVIRSHVFPGLWLDAKSLLTGDVRKALACLQTGIDTPEHAAFARKLQTAAR